MVPHVYACVISVLILILSKEPVSFELKLTPVI
jgi:hypothetical protein